VYIMVRGRDIYRGLGGGEYVMVRGRSVYNG
jgi:hypothetical protein